MAQVTEHTGPELGASIDVEPLAQNIPRDVRQIGRYDEHCLIRDIAVDADIDTDRFHEDGRIAGLQRSVLPSPSTHPSRYR